MSNEAINVKRKYTKRAPTELSASERIMEIDEQVEVLLNERRALLSKLDEEIANLQKMRNRVPNRVAVNVNT